ncbi:MAG: hypothetical protein JWN34_281 [Bryobacterales bacterium]|nr:hypothetical protein [Bryobacterales bacterium]
MLTTYWNHKQRKKLPENRQSRERIVTHCKSDQKSAITRLTALLPPPEAMCQNDCGCQHSDDSEHSQEPRVHALTSKRKPKLASNSLRDIDQEEMARPHEKAKRGIEQATYHASPWLRLALHAGDVIEIHMETRRQAQAPAPWRPL